MFNNSRKKLLFLIMLASVSGASLVYAEEAGIATVNTASLPINVANQAAEDKAPEANAAPNALVSPSKTTVTPSESKKTTEEKKSTATPPQAAAPAASAKAPSVQQTAESKSVQPVKDDDFSFDLKMKNINAKADGNAGGNDIVNINLPQQASPYSTNPVDNLSNSILSQMDSDLFSQMSEIEKSTTLLTLELRREKIRNEIEAQKAMRQKAFDDLEKTKAEAKLKELERKKEIEAQALREKQILVDKEQLLEVLKQRKLLNAYMNQMLVVQQEWLKEKEGLYEQLAAAEVEKKELIALFKHKLDTVLEASAKNIQAAEAAKANFERVVAGLKSRNEQLRKRVEADAKLIKSAKNSLYLKSQSIEELKEKNAANATTASLSLGTGDGENSEIEDIEEIPAKISAQYALLGITGRADTLSVDVIDVDGQPISLRIGSPLPSGHVLTEVGSEYAKFSRDGRDEYLYIGRTIDGYIPTVGLTPEQTVKTTKKK